MNNLARTAFTQRYIMTHALSAHLGDAVITDLRPLVRLPEILLNFAQNLPSTFVIHFLHGEDNHVLVRSEPSLKSYFHSHRLRLRFLRNVAPDHYEAALAAKDIAKGQLTPNDRAKHLKWVACRGCVVVDRELLCPTTL